MKLNWLQKLVRIGILSILLLAFSFGFNTKVAWSDIGSFTGGRIMLAFLAQGDFITDPEAILRYALPIDDNNIRQVQTDIEGIEKNVRRQRWRSVSKDAKNAAFILKLHGSDIVASLSLDHKPKGDELMTAITENVGKLNEAIAVENKPEINILREEILSDIGDLEALMVKGYPFEVPSKYANLPQLLGRATVEMETTKGNLSIIVDGYSAPVNAGNFVDLVQRGFYDGLPFIRAEDYFVLQTGDPIGEEDGFLDPKTGEYRAIPLEILLEGKSEPLYEFTTEDVGLYLANPVLPFNAYGAVALARPSTDPNGGSSQFFFFKFDTELTPPGYNLMDGRYSVFGYAIDGADVLDKLTEEDKIISAKVVKGIENLVEPE